ncbi:hypothetical protein [Burkholderia pseudomallei]|uniref:hypothetical protein n=1 Tax=Burkholderia pseudomallei TaxID=28450 RepID=UPI0021F7A85A|nr:hypothetical protein [Burkholderia pseudomallei]MCW0131858.1 hypothetical protein [Burkholderia pseudomallei]
MQTLEELTGEFLENVDQIAAELVAGFGLKHSHEVDGLQTPLLRWLDFRLRTIDPRPRQIHVSDRFPKSLDELTAQALGSIERAIRNGDDINRFQSKGLLRSDSSGKNRSERTDLLWADWGIHHLHLAEESTDGYFSARGDFLLFAMFGLDVALFVDIHPHAGDPLLFAREDLIRVVTRNWPAIMEPFELKGMLVRERPVSDDDRKVLRKSGLDAPLVIDGKAYFSPGRGVTSASTPGKVTDAMWRLRRNVRALAQQVTQTDGQFLAVLPEACWQTCHFSLRLLPSGVVVHERSTDYAWTLPDAKFDGTDTLLAEISDALSPPWVKQAVQEAVSSAKSEGTTPGDAS